MCIPTTFKRALYASLTLVFGALSQTTPAAAQPHRPNIVILFTDDLGYNDLSCYGSPSISTPNLDRLAQDGIRFTDFYSAAPVCTPSRAALMTGCYPPRLSMGFIPPDPTIRKPNPQNVLYPGSQFGLNPAETTLAEVLKSAGYKTMAVGKWHLGDRPDFHPTRQGFDHYFGIPYSNDMQPTLLLRDQEVVENPVDQASLTDKYTNQAIAFIKKNAKSAFFLYLAYNAPHTPLHFRKDLAGSSPRGPYGDCIANVDQSVGSILATLKSEGIDSNTLIIFTSDNGPWIREGEDGGSANPLRSGKMSAYEGGYRVPCIMRWPQHLQSPGRTCKEVASTIDFLPTFAHLAGAPLPKAKIDGKDISPLLLQNEAKSPHDAFFYYIGDKLTAVRAGKWKLKVPTTLVEDFGYKKLDQPDAVIPLALYNLDWDPGEQKDVSKDHKDIVKQLTALLDAQRKTLGDERTKTPGPEKRPIGVTSKP